MIRPGGRSRLTSPSGSFVFVVTVIAGVVIASVVIAISGVVGGVVGRAANGVVNVAVFAAIGYYMDEGLAAAKFLWSGFRDRLKGLLVSSLTELAALIAGRHRSALRDEWRAHLAGESGHDPDTWAKARQALGFVAAAIRLRLADTVDLAWKPVDAVLGSRTLSNLFVWVPVIAMLVAIDCHDGLFGLVADIQDPAALGAFLYGVVRTGRWWRRVKPPEPKARRARE